MTLLAKQRILLIGIGFYDYDNAIAAELRALGADVWIENQVPPQLRGPLAPIRRRLSTDLRTATTRYLRAVRARARAIGQIDRVIIINGTQLNQEFILGLRADHPGVELIAYYWDSMARFPSLGDKVGWFDRVLTFDHGDAAADKRLILRPNFFRPELTIATASPSPTVDLSFVGWLHHDRLSQIERLRDEAKRLELSINVYLSTGVWTKMKLVAQGRDRDVHARAQPFARYVATSLASRAFLDLPHPEQTGLSMRAIDAIGTGRKLITTGMQVTHYDFFRPENIQVLDPIEPRIDPAFLAAPVRTLPAELVERYSLRAWALDVLGLTDPTSFVYPSGAGPH